MAHNKERKKKKTALLISLRCLIGVSILLTIPTFLYIGESFPRHEENGDDNENWTVRSHDSSSGATSSFPSPNNGVEQPKSVSKKRYYHQGTRRSGSNSHSLSSFPSSHNNATTTTTATYYDGLENLIAATSSRKSSNQKKIQHSKRVPLNSIDAKTKNDKNQHYGNNSIHSNGKVLLSTMTTTTENNTTFSTTKPHFIVHVGPPKTGTTTIQCALQEYADVLADLDQVYYLGAPCYGKSINRMKNGEMALVGGLVYELKEEGGGGGDEGLAASIGGAAGAAMSQKISSLLGRSATKTTNTKANGNTRFGGGQLELLRKRMEYHYDYYNRQRHHDQNNSTFNSPPRPPHHLLLSMEGLSRRVSDDAPIAVLADLTQNWTTHIVITYRHYFDWLPSLYFQEQKEALHSVADKRINQLLSEQLAEQEKGNDVYTTTTTDNIDSSSSSMLSSFSKYLQSHLKPTKEDWKRAKDKHSLGQHMSLRAYRLYKKHFDNVKVFHFHNPQHHNQQGDHEDDLATNFICETIPPAWNLCNKLREAERQKQQQQQGGGGGTTPPKNKIRHASKNMDGLRLLEAALQVKLIRPRPGRTASSLRAAIDEMLEKEVFFVRDDDGNQQNNMIHHPLLTCLDSSTEQSFLLASVGFEQDLLTLQGGGDKGGRGGPSSTERAEARAQHVKLFEMAKHKGKFCELDPGKVLRNETWRKILSEL